MRYNIHTIRMGLISKNIIEVCSNPECDLEISTNDMFSLRPILGCFDISDVVLDIYNKQYNDLFLLYYYCTTPDNIMCITRFIQNVPQTTLDELKILHSIIMSYPDKYISRCYKWFELNHKKSLTYEVINAL